MSEQPENDWWEPLEGTGERLVDPFANPTKPPATDTTAGEPANTPHDAATDTAADAATTGPADGPADGDGSGGRVIDFPPRPDREDRPNDDPGDREDRSATDPDDDRDGDRDGDSDAGLVDGPPGVVVGPVLEGELLSEAENAELDRRLSTSTGGAGVLVRRAGVATRDRTVWAAGAVRTAVTHPHTRTAGKLAGRNLWYPVAGAGVVIKRWRDTHGANRYERMMRRAEIAGDHEALLEWESRDVAEKQRRHERVMDWVQSPLDLVKAVAVGIFAVAGLLVGLGVILAIANKDIGMVLAPITAVISAIAFIFWFLSVYGATMLLAGTAGCVAYLWHTGRTRTEAPAWMAPLGETDGDRDVVPDERAIISALRNLNLGPLNRKFKEGWQPRWVQASAYDGKGWRAQLLLPESVTVQMIVDRKDLLAHNLLRLPVEVWPTEPRDKPGVLDLLVLDQGSMTKPVDPWPLVTEGTADYFKGVPIGVDPRGRTVIGRLFQANWGAAGMMGSGKSTLIITMLLGAILDPLVDVDVYCMAQNADYDPLRPRLRTLFKSDDPDEVPQVLVALKQLMSELSERGRLLSAAGETKLTRELAAADPRMRPRVVVIDECQELFVSPVGAEAAELLEKMIAKARKYGVSLVFATPVPSADSLPRKVAKVLSNKACFAIGDHQGNDAILGTGKHKAGITAVNLRPMSKDPETGEVDPGDIGTAMTVGFMPQDSLMRCYRVIKEKNVDQVTPVVQRAMDLLDGTPTTPPADPGDDTADADPLRDVAEVLAQAGKDLMGVHEVLQALAALNPDAYTGWAPAQLRRALPEAAQPYKTKGTMHISARRVAEALADRDLYPNTDRDDDLDDDPDADPDDDSGDDIGGEDGWDAYPEDEYGT